MICLFNIKYLGYYKFKFFGLDLSNYKIVWEKFLYYCQEYNYFILIILNLFILNIIIYKFNNYNILILFILLFYIFIFLSLKIKKKWNELDINYKTKLWNLGFNIILILVLGYYINLIIEYLVSSFIWKINGSEYFLKSFQNKLILNFAYNRSFHRWFSFYNYKK